MKTNVGNLAIEWLGHASFKIRNKVVLYIDPYVLPRDAEKADIILATHDHCDPGKIEEIRKEGTTIVATSACGSKLEEDIKIVEVGNSVSVRGVGIEAVLVYNTEKPFHPRGQGVGYVIEVEGTRIYHSGDTDFIPEMEDLKGIDIALLPIGGTYTMNVEEAAEAGLTINPKITIPMHYNYISGTEAEKFKELVEKNSKIEVRIL